MTPILMNIAATLAMLAYLPSQSGVKFNHAAHFSERGIECSTCHTVAVSTSSADKNIPGHDICTQCHSVSNAPEDCKLCHVNPENPTGVTLPPQELIFSHRAHLTAKITSGVCLSCHTGVDKAEGPLGSANFPSMKQCFECHNGIGASSECRLCHSQPAEMSQLVHPPDWKHSHKFEADARGKSCGPCHQTETFCSDCHAGDNLVETVHDLNYRYTHGLDAKGKEYECQSCHDYETFCSSCHMSQGDQPLNHQSLEWVGNPRLHAEAAQKDIESCAACHATESATCARGGCHRDSDGVRGTNPDIHDASIDDLGHGPWHDDPSFECFQCHTNTQRPGTGFCGYCHGSEVD